MSDCFADMSTFKATRIGLAAWLISAIVPMSAQADPGKMRAGVHYRDGSVTYVERLDNRTVRLETSIGTQTLAFSQISRLTLDPEDPERVILETITGDRWVGSLSLRPLMRRLPLMRENEDRITVVQILIHTEPRSPLPASINTRIALQDGSIIRINAGQTAIAIKHEHGQWLIPVASADAISFAINDDAWIGAAWFSSDRLFLRGEIMDRALVTQDRFGNALTIPFEEIKGIRTIHPIGERPQPDNDTVSIGPAGTPTDTWTWKRHEPVELHDRFAATGRSSQIATTVWSLETTAATISVPSPLVHQVVNDPLSGRSLIRTVAGESFRGRLRSGPLQLIDDHNEAPTRRLALEALDRLAYDRRPATAPAGWPTWRLISGDVFYGQFVDQELPVDQPGRRGAGSIPSADVRGAFPHEDTGQWMLETVTGPYPLYSRTREVDVLLAVNGMQINVPWDAVERISSEAIDRLPPSTAVPSGRSFLQDAVRIEGSEFMIGRQTGEGMPDEIPAVNVQVPTFIMDVAPVTRAQFAAFVRDTGYRSDAEQANASSTWRNPGFPQRNSEPVVFVTWNDAARFCNWRSQQAGLESVYEFSRRDTTVTTHRHRNGFRLPTEAEWEYAARAGGQDQRYPWGNDNDPETLKQSANYRRPDAPSAWPWTTPVKNYPANALGLYDMAGNVWEWCEDWYFDQAYQTVFRLQPFNPVVPANSLPGLTHRVMRGGSFQNHADLLRCASRGHGLPGQSANRVGFRTVRNVPASP